MESTYVNKMNEYILKGGKENENKKGERKLTQSQMFVIKKNPKKK
jgi:hypothetical protein